MHGPKRFVTAAALAALAFAPVAAAQKDAAEKAREGGIEHWIEYYKAQQRMPSGSSAQESGTQAGATQRPDPADRPGPDVPGVGEKTEKK